MEGVEIVGAITEAARCALRIEIDRDAHEEHNFEGEQGNEAHGAPGVECERVKGEESGKMLETFVSAKSRQTRAR
jgi:hypothetical protein